MVTIIGRSFTNIFSIFCMVLSQKIKTVCNLVNIKPLNSSSLLTDLIVLHFYEHTSLAAHKGTRSFQNMHVFKCIHENAPKYLSDFISHTSELSQVLSQDLLMTQHRLLHILDEIVSATNHFMHRVRLYGMPS